MGPARKVFVVAGGASGLGAATTRALVAQGANVIIADIDAARGTEIAQETGEQSRFISTDVTNTESVQAAIDAAHQNFGGLHGAINCAGIATAERVVGRRGPHRPETFMQTVEVNLFGSFQILRLAAAAMADNPPAENGERGVIINTASIAAYEGQVGQLAYAASKGAIAAMTLPAARDLAQFGIRVVAIAPGLFDTPLLAGLPEEARDVLGKQTPFPQRLGHPDEFAALAIHIIENSMINGEVIRIDGALRMGSG